MREIIYHFLLTNWYITNSICDSFTEEGYFVSNQALAGNHYNSNVIEEISDVDTLSTCATFCLLHNCTSFTYAPGQNDCRAYSIAHAVNDVKTPAPSANYYTRGTAVSMISTTTVPPPDTDCGLDDTWTIIQQRFDGSVSFNRDWNSYVTGFGDNPNGEFWLGLARIKVQAAVPSELIIRIEDYAGVSACAHYNSFSLTGSQYALEVSEHSGTLGDSLIAKHNAKPFSTYDNDNDEVGENCAEYHTGGWWFSDCLDSNLNGLYNPDIGGNDPTAMVWRAYSGYFKPLKKSLMAIRVRPKS